jgi:hypothetical protein
MKHNSSLTSGKWSEVKDEIRGILVDTARAGHLITYSELTAMLQTAYVHYHSQVLVQLLIDIGREEYQADRPSLPALVVAKQTGMPGAGFFKIDPGEVEIDDPQRYWEDAVRQVYAYWSQH